MAIDRPLGQSGRFTPAFNPHHLISAPHTLDAADYGLTHPPILPDAHHSAPQPNRKVDDPLPFGFSPRSAHISSQPRTHSTFVIPSGVVFVGPPGAVITNSKSG